MKRRREVEERRKRQQAARAANNNNKNGNVAGVNNDNDKHGHGHGHKRQQRRLSRVKFIRVKFAKNTANKGGAIWNDGSHTEVEDSFFWKNKVRWHLNLSVCIDTQRLVQHDHTPHHATPHNTTGAPRRCHPQRQAWPHAGS